MAITNYYVDPAINADSGTGTIGDPFGDLQYALNTIVRNATDGDQVNVKSGAAEVLAAPLTLATYGTPTETAPLILRGYTAAANDGGVGVIDGNAGGFGIMASRYADTHFADLRLTNVGAAHTVLEMGARSIAYRCEADHAAMIGFGTNSLSMVVGCYAHDVPRGIQTGYGGGTLIGNLLVPSGAGYGIYNNGTHADMVLNNIVLCSNAGAFGYYANNANDANGVIGNIFYNTAAGTTAGVLLNDNPSGRNQIALNNIICGWSGAGGVGLRHDGYASIIGHNAFYNNTTAKSCAAILDLGGDVALAADPFTDAANGDFSLTDAAKLALAAAGWPASYLGAHANTITNLNIGPIQMAAGAGGGVIRRAMRILGG